MWRCTDPRTLPLPPQGGPPPMATGGKEQRKERHKPAYEGDWYADAQQEKAAQEADALGEEPETCELFDGTVMDRKKMWEIPGRRGQVGAGGCAEPPGWVSGCVLGGPLATARAAVPGGQRGPGNAAPPGAEVHPGGAEAVRRG